MDVLPGKKKFSSLGNTYFRKTIKDKLPEYLDLKAKGSNKNQISKWIQGFTTDLVDKGQFQFYYWDTNSASNGKMDLDRIRGKVAFTFRNLATTKRRN